MGLFLQPALLVEMGEVPLKIRRIKLALHFVGKLQGQEAGHPGRQLLEDSWESGVRGRRRWSFVNGVRAEVPEIELRELGPVVVCSCVRPWMLPNPEVDWSVMEKIREEGRGNQVNVVRERLQVNWAHHLQIFTDGSVKPNSKRAGFAVHIPDLQISQGRWLSDRVAVFTAEISAITWALDGEVRPQQVVVCSDLAAVLMALQGGGSRVRPDLISELATVLYKINMAGCSVGFLWVPAHVGVEGN